MTAIYLPRPGGGCECVCPANILIFYFSATIRDNDMKFIQFLIPICPSSVCPSVCPSVVCPSVKIEGGRGLSQKRFSNFSSFLA